MSQTASVRRDVNIPTVPNFIQTTDGAAVPIESFTDQELEDIAAKWTDWLLYKARKRRNQQEPPHAAR